MIVFLTFSYQNAEQVESTVSTAPGQNADCIDKPRFS